MTTFRRNLVATGLLAFASYTSAQVASYCPKTDVCYKLNIPESTASSGNGDIFFQLSAPSSYEWVALGQGTSMSGSQIFVVYTSGDGNVTISPRLGVGERMPNFNGDAQVTLLEGSGVSDGKMTANVKCSSCNSWSGGTASFSEGNGNWIWASHSSGGSKDTTDQSAGIAEHDDHASFQWDYASAKGGNSVNPLVNAAGSGTTTAGGTRSCVPRPTGSGAAGTSGGAAATTTGPSATKTDDDDDDSTRGGRPTNYPTGNSPSEWSGNPTARPTGPPGNYNDKREEKRQEINYCDEDSNANSGITVIGSSQSNNNKMLIAHGAIAALVVAILFPSGAIAIRLASFTGAVWVHAVFQGFAYLLYIVAFGLGVHIATEKDMLKETHPIIGIVVFALLFFQPFLGLLHHSAFKKHQTRTLWSYAHVWLGRIVITLGIINGGLGFKLAENTGNRSAMIAYAVIAGVFWVVWAAAAIVGERKRKRSQHAPPKYTESQGSPAVETSERSDVPHPENGHFAPAKGERTV